MVKFLIILLLTAQVAVGANYTNAASGAFSVGATWTGGVAPSLTGDTWRIASGTTVWYDVDNSTHGGTPVASGGWGASVVEGTLAITNGATVNAYLKMNGNLSGAGDFIIGTASDPITNLASAYPAVVFSQRNATAYITMTKAGGIMWYANTNQFTDYITNSTVVAGDNTNLWFTANVSNLASNDVICINNHNTTGAAGTTHVVYSVETNRVTVFNAITADAQLATNTWYGQAMTATIVSNARTNGSLVVKLSRPVVAVAPNGTSSTGVFNGSHSNTISGIRFQFFSLGAVESLNGWIINSCVAVVSTTGGLTYDGNYHALKHCIGFNSQNGLSYKGSSQIIENCVVMRSAVSGISVQGTNHIITSCIARNVSNGGIANGGVGLLIQNCVGNNNGSGGLLNAGLNCTVLNSAGTNNSSALITLGYGNIIQNCVGYKNSNGGIVNAGFGFTIQNCVGISNTLGGIVSSGNGHTIKDCVGAGNTSGGISYLGTQNIINCSATNQAVPTIAYYPNATTILNTNGASLDTEVTFQPSARAPYDVLLFCGTNWASIGGLVYKTNIATTFSDTTLAHVPATVLKAVPLYADISMKPYSGRSVGVWVYRTNDIAWSYEVTPFLGQPCLAITSIPYATTGWFRTSVQLTNSLPKTMTQRLWLQSVSTNALYVGYSWIDVPTDYTTQYQ